MSPRHYPALLEGHSCQRLFAAFASSPAALAVLAVRSTPRSQPPAGQCGAFADSTLGAWARRVAPLVSVPRGAHWCAAPLRRRVAPWRSLGPVGAPGLPEVPHRSGGSRGANAVVAMRFNRNEIGDIMSEVAAYGTAVNLEPIQSPPPEPLLTGNGSASAGSARLHRWSTMQPLRVRLSWTPLTSPASPE